jgi:hypothetical protein
MGKDPLGNIQKIDPFILGSRNNPLRNSSITHLLINLLNKLKYLKVSRFIFGQQKGFKFFSLLTKRWVDLIVVAFSQVG